MKYFVLFFLSLIGSLSFGAGITPQQLFDSRVQINTVNDEVKRKNGSTGAQRAAVCAIDKVNAIADDAHDKVR